MRTSKRTRAEVRPSVEEEEEEKEEEEEEEGGNEVGGRKAEKREGGSASVPLGGIAAFLKK